jgi:hypothetical protein
MHAIHLAATTAIVALSSFPVHAVAQSGDTARIRADSIAFADSMARSFARSLAEVEREIAKRRQWFSVSGPSDEELRETQTFFRMILAMHRLSKGDSTPLPPTTVDYQPDPPDPSRRPTVVLLGLDSAAPDPRLIIYMRRGYQPEALLTVPVGTSAEQLAGAFQVLNDRWRELRPTWDTLLPGELLRHEVGPPVRTTPLTATERSAYEGMIRSFVIAREIVVPGVGRGPMVEVLMPAWPPRQGARQPDKTTTSFDQEPSGASGSSLFRLFNHQTAKD